jgi:hypothetical protein
MNRKIYASELYDLPFETLKGRDIMIHTVASEYPAHVLRVTRNDVTVQTYPMGTLRIDRVSEKSSTWGGKGVWLVDPHVGGREWISSITLDVPYKHNNPGGQHLPCGTLSPRKCRQLQHVYESERSRGLSKKRSAQAARSEVGKTANPDLNARVRRLKNR